MPENYLTAESLFLHLQQGFENLRNEFPVIKFHDHFFSLFLFKRLNNLFEEEFSKIVKQETVKGKSRQEGLDIAEDPDEYRFYIPPQARWHLLIQADTNRTDALITACNSLEEHYPRLLAGVFSPLQSVGSKKDRRNFDKLVWKMIEQFDKLTLNNRGLLTPQAVGQASRKLIEHFAVLITGKANILRTPQSVLQLLTGLLQPQSGMRICDPVCGSGGSLVASSQYIENHGGDQRNLSILGQEYNKETSTLCKINLLLNDIADAKIRTGDTIREPFTIPDGRLMKFDLVITNLFDSTLLWDRAVATSDPWERFSEGVLPQKRGEMIFVQHIAATLTEQGRAVMIVPHGVLFRSGIEKAIRAKFLQQENDLIEAVISFPNSFFYNTSKPCAILCLNKNKTPERAGKVLFINIDGVSQGRQQQMHFLSEYILEVTGLYRAFGNEEKLLDEIQLIAQEWEKGIKLMEKKAIHNNRFDEVKRKIIGETFNGQIMDVQTVYEDVQIRVKERKLTESFATTATLNEIAEKYQYNLNPRNYLNKKDVSSGKYMDDDLKELHQLEIQRAHAEERMNDLLQELGYGVS